MPTLAEFSGAVQQPQGTSQIHAALAAGVEVLSGDQTVSFVPYVRTVLPIDGFVFYVNAALLSPQQLAQNGLQTADPVTIAGSLHYASVGVQDVDQTIVIRKVDFTAQSEVTALSTVTQGVLYVAQWDTSFGPFRFTFSTQNAFYEEASEYHYVGDAVYPVFEAQLIDTLDGINDRQIVSNSLPIWLAMVQGISFPASDFVSSNLPLYPSFLVPNNLVPPYGAVMVSPNSTNTLQLLPWLDRLGNQWQLTREHVQFALYGLRNDEALDFQQYLIDYSIQTNLYGLASPPVVRDQHRKQTELVTLAQSKIIEFDINYYQTCARDLARQVIAHCVPSFALNPYPPLPSN